VPRRNPHPIHHQLDIRKLRFVQRLLQLDLAHAGASGHALISLIVLVQGRQAPLAPESIMLICIMLAKLVKLLRSSPRATIVPKESKQQLLECKHGKV
jgi:hypothetical protein